MKTIRKHNSFKRVMNNAGRSIRRFFCNRSAGDITLMISVLCCIFIFAIVVTAVQPIIAVNAYDDTTTEGTSANLENKNTETTTNGDGDTTLDPETTRTSNDTDIIEPVVIVKYVVESGDSFWNIAKKFYNDASWHLALMRYNGYDENDVLRVGDMIEIPSTDEDTFIAIYEEINQEIAESAKAEADKVTGTVIKAGDNNKYKYGVRTDPTVDIRVPEADEVMKNYTGEVDTSNFTYLGAYTTTGYTPKCVHCCGNDKGIGAAGVPVICGYSVAAPSNIPLGTTLYIEGYGFYVVEDRGNFGNKNIDIACPSHESCSDVTNVDSYVNVYIVPNN